MQRQPDVEVRPLDEDAAADAVMRERVYKGRDQAPKCPDTKAGMYRQVLEAQVLTRGLRLLRLRLLGRRFVRGQRDLEGLDEAPKIETVLTLRGPGARSDVRRGGGFGTPAPG